MFYSITYTWICAGSRFFKTAMLIPLLFLFTIQLRAQNSEYELVAHYNSENGLPQNSITSIGQDENGFIWVCTTSGLVRFDGRGFKIFNTILYNPKASNRLQNLFKYSDRWMAEESGVDGLFEITNQSLVKAVDRGQLLGAWQSRLMFRDTGLIHSFFQQHNFNNLTVAITDRSGKEGYSVGDRGDIVRYFRVPDIFSSLDIRSPFSINDYFTIKSRLYVFEDKKTVKGFDKEVRLAPIKGSLPLLISTMNSDERLASAFRQMDSMVYFYTNSSVYLIKERGPGVVDAELLTSKADMENKSEFLYLPEKNLLLIGTTNSGLYVFGKKQFNVLRFSDKFIKGPDQLQRENPSYNIFYALQALNDSIILTDWGAISTTGRLAYTTKGTFNPYSIPRTRNGYIVGKKPGEPEFYVYDTALNVRKVIPLESNKSFGSFFNDKDTLYLAVNSASKDYVRKYFAADDGGFLLLQEIPLSDNSFGSLNKIIKTRDNKLWLGTTLGVWLLDLQHLQFSKLAGMDTATVRTLYEDSSGNVWIGTYGRGWYRYRKASGLLRMPEDRNHNLSNVHAFAVDAKGYLWLSTNNGLFRFLHADLDAIQGSDQPLFYNYFTREYGFLTNEFNGGGDPSVITMPDGRVVFPGMNGLVIFDPAKVLAEGPGSVLLIEEISLDNKAIEMPEGASLPPDFNTLSLSVAIPYFGQHNNLQVEYQLSGGSAVWTQLPEDGVININRLTHGDYVLTVRMLKGYGSRDYIYKIIQFSVEPHWYQTNWFRAAALLLFVAVVSLLARIRIKNIQRQKKHLEEVVTSRTRELEMRTHELEASEEKIKQNTQFKAQVTSLVLHDVRSPLYYLNKITRNIYQSTEGKVPDSIREELKDLHLSVKDIAAYAQTLFAWISAQQDDFIISPVRIKLRDLLEEVCGNYQLLAAQNHNAISYEAAQELSVITQADLLQIVIRNLVDNAIKFTANGSIILTAEIKGKEVYITVKDTGKGMTADRVDRILGKDEDDVTDTRSGMGYRLIRDLLKKMEGRLAIVSEQGKGSAVTIILPVAAATA